jgi:uncharacterized protein (DUF885 family)
VQSTAQGFHRFAMDNLREQLDDFSPQALRRQRAFFERFRAGMAREVRRERLTPEDKADHDLIQNQISLNLHELSAIQSYRHNPTIYVELIGHGLFSLYSLEFDKDLKHRYFYLIRRMENVPRLLDEAKAQLVSAPGIWIQVAIAENEGNIALIDDTLRKACPEGIRSAYDKAAAAALPALRSFNQWMTTDLAARPYDWRLPKDQYDRKFELTLGQKPDEVLAQAEVSLKTVQAEMKALAGKEGLRVALDRIARQHTTRQDYFAAAERSLKQAREFVVAQGIVTLTPNENLKVIETPVFMRGIYGVGGFNPAPALAPELGAYYWLTPIPPDWPQERVESKLREYNRYGMQLLTIHEAMPGHYVQFEWANRVEPRGRRVLRSVFGRTAYLEGWAVYITEAMLDAGYMEHSKDLRLTFLKQQLRVITNAILDIRLHTRGMTDQQALDLMINEAYQEREEAVAKLQRAKLSSCQLPTYFAGYHQFIQLRDRYRKARPGSTLREFHDRVVRVSALPIPIAGDLILNEPSGTPSR